MKEKLVKSAVIFDEAKHTYHLNGEKLGGVTPIVKWVYPDTYKDIPESVLAKAAEHGSLIHKACQLYNEAGIADDAEPQVADYIQLVTTASLVPVASEYTVSENEHIASQIDVVYKGSGKGNFVLADIKTTSAIHVENVTLQLSIYAWLFEMQNPGKYSEMLLVVWLPKMKYGQSRLMKLKRIPVEVCEEVVKSYVDTMQSDIDAEEKKKAGQRWAQVIAESIGEQPGEVAAKTAKETPAKTDELPAQFAEVEKEIIRIEVESKKLQDRSKELRAGLLKQMQEHNVKKWVSEHLELTRRAATTRTSVDSSKLKKNYPEVYAECCKTSAVAESLMLKVK